MVVLIFSVYTDEGVVCVGPFETEEEAEAYAAEIGRKPKNIVELWSPEDFRRP